ncbi:MAG: squalene synthase HpnC [Vicinamibacterales bacterium]
MTALVAGEPGATLERAYAACEQLARDHYENFPVASILLPKSMRPAIAAIYAFARRADDFADEPGYSDVDRLRLLDAWSRRLHAGVMEAPGGTSPEDLTFVALADAIRTHRLPVPLFDDLLSAFRQDVTVKRYRTWNDVLDYCSRSANPVGRLVLRVAGYDNPALDRASDAVCTALQLTNFWQDLARDWANGRSYVPLTDRDRAGARDADLDAGRLSPEWRDALRAVSSRTRELFEAGRPVCDGVTGRLKYELRLTWLGGMRILDSLEHVDFDVFRQRPALSLTDAIPLLWRAGTWRVV